MEEAAAWWNKPVGPATVLAAAAALLEAVATAGSEHKVDITESSCLKMLMFLHSHQKLEGKPILTPKSLDKAKIEAFLIFALRSLL